MDGDEIIHDARQDIFGRIVELRTERTRITTNFNHETARWRVAEINSEIKGLEWVMNEVL